MGKREIPLFTNDFRDEGIINPRCVYKCLGQDKNARRLKGITKYIVTFPYMSHLIARAKTMSWKEMKWHRRLGLIRMNRETVGFLITRPCAPPAIQDLEDLILFGARHIILTGGVGVIDGRVKRGDLIIPDQAIRDEGASYHYLKAGAVARPSAKLFRALRASCAKLGFGYFRGKVWTTDAVYRETPTRIKKFGKAGAVCVDMEAAACFAVARYRKIQFAVLFYGGDYVHERKWYPRMAGRKFAKQYEGRLMEIMSDVYTHYI